MIRADPYVYRYSVYPIVVKENGIVSYSFVINANLFGYNNIHSPRITSNMLHMSSSSMMPQDATIHYMVSIGIIQDQNP